MLQRLPTLRMARSPTLLSNHAASDASKHREANDDDDGASNACRPSSNTDGERRRRQRRWWRALTGARPAGDVTQQRVQLGLV